MADNFMAIVMMENDDPLGEAIIEESKPFDRLDDAIAWCESFQKESYFVSAEIYDDDTRVWHR